MKKLLVIGSILILPFFSGMCIQPSQSAAGKVQKAREELAGLLEKFTETHPAVQSKRHEVSAIMAAELDKLQAELRALLERYTNLHPFVQQKCLEIAALK